MKTVKTSIGTVRRNTVKARLILFSVLAIALIVCSFFSEYLTPHDPYLQNLDIAKQAPTKAHPLGTDRYGRDMLSRVIAGSRASIFSTLLLVAIITTLGTAVDVTLQKQVVEEMRMVRDTFGTAIVLVAHNLGVIGAMADNVLVLKDGKAVEYGKTGDVLANPQADYTRALLAAVPRLRR